MDIHLIDQDHLILLLEQWVKFLQFASQYVKILQEVVFRNVGNVYQMNQKLRPLDVSEEPVSQATTLARPFDQTGDVRYDERTLIIKDDDA